MRSGSRRPFNSPDRAPRSTALDHPAGPGAFERDVEADRLRRSGCRQRPKWRLLVASGVSCRLLFGRCRARAQIGSSASRDAVHARPNAAALAATAVRTHTTRWARIWPHSQSPPMTSSTNAVWATSIPRLNAASAAMRCEVTTPRLSRLDAKPETVDEADDGGDPRSSLVGAAADREHGGGDDRQRDGGFDHPRRNRDQLEVGETEADRVAERERRDQLDGASGGRPGNRRPGDRQREHEQEQQVVGAESDVLDAEIEERPGARPRVE